MGEHNALTIDEYISAYPEEVQNTLADIRFIISDALPDAEERIYHKIPTFWRKTILIQFAAHRNFVTVFPGEKALEALQDEAEIKDFKCTKNGIRMSYKKVNLKLVQKLAEWCGRHN